VGISATNTVVKGYSYLTHAEAIELEKQVEHDLRNQYPDFICKSGNWRSFSLEPLPALMTEFKGVPRDKCRVVTHRESGERIVAKLYEPVDCDAYCRAVFDDREGTILGELPPIKAVQVDFDEKQDLIDEWEKLVGQKVRPLLAAKDKELAKNPSMANYRTKLENLTHCDGLLGDLVDWIDDTSRIPNRIFAMGSAISVVGTLLGRKVAGPTESGTHLYILGLMDTAGGKAHGMNQGKNLLHAAGAADLIGPGRFTTGPAISNHLEERPLSLSFQDEFGSFIKRITKSDDGWQREAATMLRELWGLPFQRYDGMRWANKKPEPIHAPAYSIFGVSTPEQFYSALQHEDLENGLLNRFLVLSCSNEEFVDERDPLVSPRKVPEQIAERLKKLHHWRSDMSPVDVRRKEYEAEPDVHGWASDDVKKIYVKWRTAIRRRIHKDKSLGVFLGRTTEIAIRLATIHAAARKPGDYDFVVTEADIRWGMALAETCGDMLAIEAGGKMVEETLDHGAAVNKVIQVVTEHGPIQRSKLLQKVQKQIKDKDLEPILKILHQSEEVLGERFEIKGKTGQVYERIYYRRPDQPLPDLT
jgi:hypothetical protein